MIACYYLNSWLKQKHFNPHVRCAFGIFSVRVSPLYWRRSNIWNWSWLQRRHDKSKDYFWSNWSTKKYKSSGTDNTWGWTRSLCFICSHMNPLFNRIWWWAGELWWPHSNLMWWMSRRQRVCGLRKGGDQHCFSWELEKNEKKIAEITFYLLKLIMKIKVQAAFLWKVYLVQWGVWMEGYDINQHNPGMC